MTVSLSPVSSTRNLAVVTPSATALDTADNLSAYVCKYRCMYVNTDIWLCPLSLIVWQTRDGQRAWTCALRFHTGDIVIVGKEGFWL